MFFVFSYEGNVCIKFAFHFEGQTAMEVSCTNRNVIQHEERSMVLEIKTGL